MHNFEAFQNQYATKYSDSIIKDGIINRDLYDSENPKILFICKEHNQMADTVLNGDYKIWWNEGLKYRFAHRISEWAYGIANDFPPIETIDDKKKKLSLKSIAFLNVKKIAGTSQSDYKDLKEIIEWSKSLIIDQVTEINPDIIICSLGYSDLVKDLFSAPTYINSGHDINYFIWNNKIVIDFYHPSIRWSRSATYYILKNVIQSVYQRNVT
ncbi:hypothetical protein [Dyadobacter frigoris]|uniref:Uracil-DNA glycosylase-like domain-containing protein n=1 Tax=Dyadobacter frigoris TaxID=2576211 RepID=A0A4U6CRW0_9BACT|nr:hypothetical protein [Dyadobacter frigoris]TKT86916.1 hypothetical protein FDK13_31205 [Dyadobacter frigoris]